jgi:hypothetical protein
MLTNSTSEESVVVRQLRQQFHRKVRWIDFEREQKQIERMAAEGRLAEAVAVQAREAAQEAEEATQANLPVAQAVTAEADTPPEEEAAVNSKALAPVENTEQVAEESESVSPHEPRRNMDS